MQRIIASIEAEKRRLEAEPFFAWLRTEDEHDTEKIAFIPAMYFYIMTFRDLLRLIEGPEDGALQSAVNAYVQEDGGHYLWYLSDLTKAGFPAVDPSTLWDVRLFPSRRAIYRMIAYAMDHEEPVLRAALVAIFEATGEVFFRHTMSLVRRLGLEERLSYFGKLHYEDEVNHSVHMDELAEIALTPAQSKLAQDIVRRAFDEYRGLFTAWHDAGQRQPAPTRLFVETPPLVKTA